VALKFAEYGLARIDGALRHISLHPTETEFQAGGSSSSGRSLWGVGMTAALLSRLPAETEFQDGGSSSSQSLCGQLQLQSSLLLLVLPPGEVNIMLNCEL